MDCGGKSRNWRVTSFRTTRSSSQDGAAAPPCGAPAGLPLSDWSGTLQPLVNIYLDTVMAFLSRQTHLPVDAVLEAECVRRGAEDWQLQNEPLDRRRTFLFCDLTQKCSCSFSWMTAGHCFCFCGWTQNPGVEIQQEQGHVLTQTNTLPVPLRTRF